MLRRGLQQAAGQLAGRQVGACSACDVLPCWQAQQLQVRGSARDTSTPRMVTQLVTAEGEGATTIAQAGKHKWVIDEPASMGGKDLGATRSPERCGVKAAAVPSWAGVLCRCQPAVPSPECTGRVLRGDAAHRGQAARAAGRQDQVDCVGQAGCKGPPRRCRGTSSLSGNRHPGRDRHHSQLPAAHAAQGEGLPQ